MRPWAWRWLPVDPEVTALLTRLAQGDRDAYDRLVTVLYADLRRAASSLMRRERDDHTLQTTALVHEACLRLCDPSGDHWESRSHFLRVAARAMRNVLVDHARERSRLKRGGRVARVPLDDIVDSAAPFFGYPSLDLVALHNALDRLESSYPRQARVVELVFFAGLSRPEAADALELSLSTVDRDWAFARVWLAREMEPEQGWGTLSR